MAGSTAPTYLADVGTSQPGTAVQLLDVVVFDLEAQAAVSMRPLTSASNMKVSFGHGEICSFSLTVFAPR